MKSKPASPPACQTPAMRGASTRLNDSASPDLAILSSLNTETPDITAEEMDVIEQYMGEQLDALIKQWRSETSRHHNRQE